MNTLLTDPLETSFNTAASHRLRTTMAAIRLSFVWLGTRKTLSNEQKSQAADTFGAEREYLSAGKKLLDTSHPAFKNVTAVRSRIIQYWKWISLPYPEPGIRLIRQDDSETLTVHLTTLKAELAEAVAGLETHYSDLKRFARTRLGSLFNSADYPATLSGLFDVTWDFPSVEPPEYRRHKIPSVAKITRHPITAHINILGHTFDTNYLKSDRNP